MILTSEGEEDPDIQEDLPRKKKGQGQRKTTPLNNRRASLEETAGGEDDEEEPGEEEDRAQEPVEGEEPIREAGPPGEGEEAPLQLEDILLTTRVAMDMVGERFQP